MRRIEDILEVTAIVIGTLFLLVYIVESIHKNAWLLFAILAIGAIAMGAAIHQTIKEHKKK